MHILHVGKYFSPFRGGLENYLRDLMAALGRRGLQGTALVHAHERTFRTRSETCHTSGRTLRVVRVGTLATVFFTPVSPAFPLQLRRAIGKHRPDLLHLHLPNPSAFWALLLPGARRLPWIVHWHADVITGRQSRGMRLLYRLYRPLEQALLRRASAVIATSQPYLDSSDTLRPWRDKCRVAPLGLDPERLNATPDVDAPEPVDANPQPRLQVLAVGRLTYYKGFRFLLEAVAQAGPPVRLDLVGDGDEAGSLQAMAGLLGLSDRVCFHGSTDDAKLARLMNRCDCLCLPSIERTEAFGMVLLEAMHCGKATVVSDVPGSGMGWVVEDAVTGVKVPPADPAALAEAFRTLAADRAGLAAMGARGRQRFEELFTIDRSAAAVAAVYREVLGTDAADADSEAM
jgi:rhamnosyl/mannosyltransferase